jgi:DNA excision repair protein ERCC-5
LFHAKSAVERYVASDVERVCGLARDDLIALALLLGSDYTDGTRS